jgi:hypothetical protein
VAGGPAAGGRASGWEVVAGRRATAPAGGHGWWGGLVLGGSVGGPGVGAVRCGEDALPLYPIPQEPGGRGEEDRAGRQGAATAGGGGRAAGPPCDGQVGGGEVCGVWSRVCEEVVLPDPGLGPPAAPAGPGGL